MFVDNAKISIKSGDGGHGVVSFRTEKFVDKGGPDGGDGGRGGDIIFEAGLSESTLANFRFQKKLTAENGQPGAKRKRHGKSGKDLLIKVPVGTVIHNMDGKILADLVVDKQRVLVARGGLGGYGNAHFKSSTRQVPRVAEKGEPGEEIDLVLELKMIADVGLVGLPNAGKSTLLSVISNARPEIANYPFTTIIPNLGVVDVDEEALLFADIPGLIEGASEGKGLGDEFLRHIERTQVLLHLIDAYQEDLAAVYGVINEELKTYRTDLSKKPQIVVLSKIDGLDSEIVNDRINELKAAVPINTKIMAISSKSRQGLIELLRATRQKVLNERETRSEEQGVADNNVLPVLTIKTEDSWRIEKISGGYRVRGRKIERFAIRTDFDNYHAVARLRDIMKKMGIMHALVRQGIEPGEKIYIGEFSIEY